MQMFLIYQLYKVKNKMEFYIGILMCIAFPCVAAEQTSVAFLESNFSIGHWMFFVVLILLIVLLIILLVVIICTKKVRRSRKKQPAEKQRPVDVLSQQTHQEDHIWSINHEDCEDAGYATAYSTIPECTRLDPKRSGSQVTLSNPASPDQGPANHFGFLQYATVHEAVSKNHHQEHAVAYSNSKKPSVGMKTKSPVFGSINLGRQPTCVVNQTVVAGADGTEYLQMTDVKSLVETPSSSIPRKMQIQNAFAASTYASIDHSFNVSPK